MDTLETMPEQGYTTARATQPIDILRRNTLLSPPGLVSLRTAERTVYPHTPTWGYHDSLNSLGADRGSLVSPRFYTTR